MVPVSHTVTNTLGALQVCLNFSLALLGAVSLQCYYYFEHYGSDRKALKFLVGALWIMETVHAVIMFHAVYVLNVNGFGSTDYLLNPPWSIKLLVPASAILDITVEACWAYRVRLLSRRWLVPIICWTLVAIRAGAVMVSTDVTFKKGIHVSMTSYKFVLGIALGPLVVIDFLVCMSLLYWLSKIRSGFPSSDQVINRLIVFAFECGIVSSCLGFVILIAAMTMSTNYIWLSILCIHSKVYSNALLLSLNRRHSMAQAYANSLRTSDPETATKFVHVRSPTSSGAPFSPSVKTPVTEQPILNIHGSSGSDFKLGIAGNTVRQVEVLPMHSRPGTATKTTFSL